MYATPLLTVSVEISEQKLCFVYSGIQSQDESIYGKYSFKEVYELSESDTIKFLYALRMQYVLDCPLEDALGREFGMANAKVTFEMFCKQGGISYMKYDL